MLTLYYSPAAISLASHIALEETGLPYKLVQVDIAKEQHLTPKYRHVHPLARVPALEISPGHTLTETPALLWYIAGKAPDAALLPVAGAAQIRAHEWMALAASSIHPHFASYFRPSRFTDDIGAHESLRRDGIKKFFELLKYADEKLGDDTFALGDTYSLCDAYLSVFFLWARYFKLPVQELPRYSKLAQTVLRRPAAQRALEQEGLDLD